MKYHNPRYDASCRFEILRNSRRLLGLLLLFAVPVSAQMEPNLLQDPSFEGTMGEDAFSKHWTKFGRAFCENITPRTKVFVAKAFGNFDGKANYSGVYQDVPAQEGKRYVATVHLRHNSGDALEGGNAAWIKLEFLDEKHKQLKAQESPVRLQSKSASNRWLFYSTGPCLAPPGTLQARLVAVFEQKSDAAGAVLFDDAELKELP